MLGCFLSIGKAAMARNKQPKQIPQMSIAQFEAAFENTNKGLREWFRVIHLMLTAKKGISSRQIGRYMGFGSVKTAWYMCHRIRAALVEKDFDKLGGVVEVDETFIGGKAYNKHGGR